jgi:division protein CdvB (Snf7/Vps24/ESCRT-III family)
MPLAVEGNGGGGITPEEAEAIKTEITSGYTAADNVLRDEMKKADEELKKSISGVNDEFKNEFNKEIKNLKTADYVIRQDFIEADKKILAHTVNGYTIESNPVLNASDLGVGDYGGLVIEKTTEECVIPSDTIQRALKKIENMNIASVLALSAAVNNLNKRLEEALERIEQLENGSIE